MSQAILVNNFHSIVCQAIHKFVQSHDTFPEALFLGPRYQAALRKLTEPAFTQIPLEKTITIETYHGLTLYPIETYHGLTLYPIDTDVLLVGIVASPES